MDWLGKHLESTYDITVEARSKPQSWNPNVWRVDRAEGRPWIARVFPPARTAAQVAGDATLLQWLASVGFPAERLAVDAAADAVSAHDGHHVLVTQFVEGGEASDVRAIGERLGWLHSLTPPAGLRDGGSWHGDPAYEGRPACDIAHALAMLDSIEARVAPHGTERFSSLRDTIAGLDACDDLPLALVHPDPGPVNAIASPDGVMLIDWAGAGIGPRLASLVLLLQVGDAATVVDGYRTHVSLTDDELARLGAALRIRAWFWAAYYFRLSVAGGTTPSGGEGWWPDDDALAAVADRAVAALRA